MKIPVMLMGIRMVIGDGNVKSSGSDCGNFSGNGNCNG